MLNKDYILDTKYQSFLKDKRVAIVGPASYLKFLSMGDKIDSYDLVVRINRGMEIINQNSVHLGTKSNILYNCLVPSPDNGGTVDIDFYKKRGIEWICTIPESNLKGQCDSNNIHHLANPNDIKMIKDNFNFHMMDKSLYGKLNNQVQCRANTGFAAIFDLLAHGVSELFVTGYSFYLDSFFNGYKKGCHRSEEQFSKECFVSKRHVQVNQWQFLKKYRDYIKVDEILGFILDMDELNKDSFNEKFGYLYTY